MREREREREGERERECVCVCRQHCARRNVSIISPPNCTHARCAIADTSASQILARICMHARGTIRHSTYDTAGWSNCVSIRICRKSRGKPTRRERKRQARSTRHKSKNPRLQRKLLKRRYAGLWHSVQLTISGTISFSTE